MINENLTVEEQVNFLTEAFKLFQGNPFAFLEEVWGLTPQPILERYVPQLERLYTTPAQYFNLEASLFYPGMFGEYDKNNHITWQQMLLVVAVYRAVNGTLPWKIAVKSGRGTGKAQHLYEIVKKIEKGVVINTFAKDIKIGDTILGLNKPTKILDVIEQPEMQLYTVTLDDGSSVIVNGKHEWTVSDGQMRKKINKRIGADKKSQEGKWETIETEEMIERGLRMWNKNPEKRFRLPIQKVEGTTDISDAYVIGVWYGDGHKNSAVYTKPDEWVAEKINSLGWETAIPNDFDKGTRTIYGFKKRLEETNADLMKEGLPSNFLNWNFSSRVELLRGLMDTDGCCDKRGLSEFTTVIPELAEDVQLLIRSLGGKTNIRIKEKTFYKSEDGERVYCKPAYRLGVTTTFNPFSLPRKANKWHAPTQDRYLYRFIDSIEPHSFDKSVCFTVGAKDSLYLLGEGLIATHNSFIVGRLGIWFLYCFALCRVMATAPNSELLSAVLWSEMSSAINSAKEPYQSAFIWQSDYIRMKANPQGWFARAKTSRPGEKGALSGMHADHMMSVVDEAAEVDAEVIDTAIETMTNDETKLMILISNPHIPIGYFKDTFGDPDWINLTFNAEESPIVSHETIAAILRKHGRDSDNYKVSVLGEFPAEGIIGNDQGWKRKYKDEWIKAFFTEPQSVPHYHPDQELLSPNSRRSLNLTRPYLGVDVGGEGDDSSEIYGRDDTRAAHVFSEGTSTPETVAKLTIRAMDELDVAQTDVTVDNFGTGADVSAKIALLSDKESFVVGLNVGQPCEDRDDQKVYLNERARLADMLWQWGNQGGRCASDSILEKELTTVYYREQNGKQQIMSKKEAKKMGIPSPNRVDALWLTFAQDRMFSLRVPRGNQLYYPDRQTPENPNTPVSPTNKHKMIPD